MPPNEVTPLALQKDFFQHIKHHKEHLNEVDFMTFILPYLGHLLLRYDNYSL